jgi:hypothetical protein
MKKKISLMGLVLGFLAGAVVALMAGSWVFWLSLGLAIGVLLGSAGSRRSQAIIRGNL